MDYQKEIDYAPNHWVCELCQRWDDVNGCLAGFNRWTECHFCEDEYIDSEYPELDGCWGDLEEIESQKGESDNGRNKRLANRR